ncbi:MAG: MATE family efflux transporter [Bacteroidales bacterium]|nr:MATE family efflux transporter [Bacteroidales bacterium]
MKNRNKNLTEGNIKKQLFDLTWPMLFGMMGIVIFNLVDTYFVGKLGVHQLAAMSFSFPIVMFINSLSQGIGIGTSSLISRNIISTSRQDVKMMASRAILLGVIVVIAFVIIGISTIRPTFSALGAKNDILNYISDYMTIWYIGVPFVVIPMIGNNIIRATGDTFTPGMLMVSSGVINIILDPLLIFGYGPFPEMGIKGAALATVIARSTSLVFILIILIKREKLLTFYFGRLKNIFATWKDVIHIAAPASLGMLITPISIGFITKIIAGYGKEAVAAFGVASRIEMFVLMVVASLGSILIIFIGQNISKQKFLRIFKSLNYALKFSLIWGVLVFVILLLFGQAIASVFTDNIVVIEITKKYFYIVGASYGFQGLVMLSTASYNGINKPYPSAVFSLIRMFILYVPLAWIGSKIFDLNGVFGAGFIANIVIGVLSFWYLHKTIKKMNIS